jgi:hypothetical protein
MLDKTINSALLALRAQIIRGNLDGLDHVEALLVQRGIDPAAHHVPRPIPRDSCKLREVKLIIIAALRDGPKRPAEIGVYFMACKPEIEPDRAMIRVYRAIYKLRDSGGIVSDGGVWRLAQ